MIRKHSGIRWSPSFTSKYNQWKTDDNGKLVRDEKVIAHIFNNFFVNIVPNVGKGTNSSFSFQTVTKENTGKLKTNLNNKKVAQWMNNPTKLVKEFGGLFSSFISSNVNKRIN